MSAPYSQPHLRTEREHEAFGEGVARGRELMRASLQDAFRAGAEYMRREAGVRWVESSLGDIPVMGVPDWSAVAAAAEGYVERLEGGQ